MSAPHRSRVAPRRTSLTTPAVALSAVVIAGLVPGRAARAQTYALVMRGVLDGHSALLAGSAATPFAAGSAFTLEAFFDARSPNLVARVGVPGFVAYTPTAMQLAVGGRTYDVQPFDAAHPTGFAVAIFDSTTPFGVPHRYGVGFIQNPLADGAGIVVDYVSASPPFRIGAGGLVPTTFTGYSGAGVTSGVCTNGAPPHCLAHAVTPIPLTWAGAAFGLQLGNYDVDAVPGGATFAAGLVAVPEPRSLALVAAGLAAAGIGAARRRGRAPTPL